MNDHIRSIHNRNHNCLQRHFIRQTSRPCFVSTYYYSTTTPIIIIKICNYDDHHIWADHKSCRSTLCSCNYSGCHSSVVRLSIRHQQAQTKKHTQSPLLPTVILQRYDRPGHTHSHTLPHTGDSLSIHTVYRKVMYRCRNFLFFPPIKSIQID